MKKKRESLRRRERKPGGVRRKKKKTRKREKATLALNVDLIDGPLELQLGAVRELSSND